MNYELAKELKDAGYPVKPYGYAPDIFVGGFVAPTLSELIEACGEDFTFHLERDRDYVWWAETRLHGVLIRQEKGATPEEAVARLWLALNKK